MAIRAIGAGDHQSKYAEGAVTAEKLIKAILHTPRARARARDARDQCGVTRDDNARDVTFTHAILQEACIEVQFL